MESSEESGKDWDELKKAAASGMWDGEGGLGGGKNGLE